MQVSLVFCFWDKEEQQNQIGAGHDADKPVIPALFAILNQKAADMWRKRTSKAEPDILNASLSFSPVQEKDVLRGAPTERFTGTTCEENVSTPENT